MKCFYHPAVESQETCSVCSKALCGECTHRIKGQPYCQDCLARGAEWAAKVKDLRLPSDSPKKAALFAIIPGMGAVYNNEYLKAITYFAVWTALVMMGNRVNAVFGFGSVVFLVFTIFDAYRTAEEKARRSLGSETTEDEPFRREGATIIWGVLLIVIGVFFLLQNFIPYYFLYMLHRLWPLLFVLLGAYLVYRAFNIREIRTNDSRSREDV